MLFFNEFLQVEKFIRDKFNGLKCYLEKRDIKDNEKLKTEQANNNLSIDQIISQQKENLQSELQPSILSRDVFRSPADAT